MRALAFLSPDLLPLKPRVVAHLVDHRPGIRQIAAWLLGTMGPSAADTVPVLAPMLNDENVGVRWQATTALANVADELGPWRRGPADVVTAVETVVDEARAGESHLTKDEIFSLSYLLGEQVRSASNWEWALLVMEDDSSIRPWSWSPPITVWYGSRPQPCV